jgi:integrase
MSRTFQEQAGLFLQEAVSRARKPLKPASVHGFESYLRKWVNPQLGAIPLCEVNNKTVKVLVAKMLQAQLSAKSIDNVVGLIKLVVSSDLDENGEPLHIRKWNSAFLDMPVVRNQYRPILTADAIARLAKSPKLGVLYTLLASTGLRIGEALGLETRHVQGRTLVVEQSCWYGQLQTPKTFNAFRKIDLSTSVAGMLEKFIGGRRFGLVFQNQAGNPHSQTNLLRRSLGARQESDESCGLVFRSAFPEILKATTKLGAAESDDGVGAADGPMHAGAFETCADGYFASGFHNARGSAQALRVELWVAHTVSVALEIVKAAACFLRARDLAADGVEQRLEFSVVEFFLPSFCPLRRAWMSETVQSFSEITQVLFGMIAVHNLGGIGKLILGKIPNPKGPISEHDSTWRMAEAAARSLPPDALGKRRTCRGGI